MFLFTSDKYTKVELLDHMVVFCLFVLNKFIYLFLAALGLCCYARVFSSCGEWGLLFIVVHGLLIAVASRCGTQALGVRASVVAAYGP